MIAPDDEVIVTPGIELTKLRTAAARTLGRPELETAPLACDGISLTPDQLTGLAPLTAGCLIVPTLPGTPPRSHTDHLHRLPRASWYVAITAGTRAGDILVPQSGRVLLGPGTELVAFPALQVRSYGPLVWTGSRLTWRGRTFGSETERACVRTTAPFSRRVFMLLPVIPAIVLALVMRNPLFLLMSLSGLAMMRFGKEQPRQAPCEDPATLAVQITTGKSGEPTWIAHGVHHLNTAQLVAQLGGQLQAKVSICVGTAPSWLAAYAEDSPSTSCSYSGTARDSSLRAGDGAAKQIYIACPKDASDLSAAAKAAATCRPFYVLTPAAPPSWTSPVPIPKTAHPGWLRRLHQQAVRAPRPPEHVSVLDCPHYLSPPARRLACVIGKTATEQVWLDLERDGPHAIIAGTTGAGKSALLRTIMFGLASALTPVELTFVLIDFKGGTSLGNASLLPHVAERVSNVDMGLAARTIAGLAQQIKQRAALNCRWEVTDYLDLCARASKGLLPDGTQLPARLVIIVDEFREVTAELPDFINDLVRIAAQGRSLGISLILATQRPAGAVNADIRANMSIRIALRMTNEGDSNDLVGIGDAAHFDHHTPGRAILATPTATSHLQVASTAIAAVPLVTRKDMPALPDPRLEEQLLSSHPPSSQPPLWSPPLTPDPPAQTCCYRECGYVLVGLRDDPLRCVSEPLRWLPHETVLALSGTATAHALASVATSAARAGLVVHTIGLDLEIPSPLRGTVASNNDPVTIMQLALRLLARTESNLVTDVVVITQMEMISEQLTAISHHGRELLERLIAQGRHRGIGIALANGSTTIRNASMRLVLGSPPTGLLDRRVKKMTAQPPAWLEEDPPVPCALFVPYLHGYNSPAPNNVLTRIVPLPSAQPVSVPENGGAEQNTNTAALGATAAVEAAAAEQPSQQSGDAGMNLAAPSLEAVGLTGPNLATLKRATTALTGGEQPAANVAGTTIPRQAAVTARQAGRGDRKTAAKGESWLIGHGGDQATAIALTPGPLLIAGPRGSGRSTLLNLIARNGGSRISGTTCKSLGTFRPASLVLVDDIDVLLDRFPGCEGALSAVVLVATATTAHCAGAFRGILSQLRSYGRGIVLTPHAPGSDEVLGVRLWSVCDPQRHTPGYGALIEPGKEVQRLQVALAHT